MSELDSSLLKIQAARDTLEEAADDIRGWYKVNGLDRYRYHDQLMNGRDVHELIKQAKVRVELAGKRLEELIEALTETGG